MVTIMAAWHSLESYEICPQFENKPGPINGLLGDPFNPMTRNSHVWDTVWITPEIHCF